MATRRTRVTTAAVKPVMRNAGTQGRSMSEKPLESLHVTSTSPSGLAGDLRISTAPSS